MDIQPRDLQMQRFGDVAIATFSSRRPGPESSTAGRWCLVR
jgi:hypothetical protein